MLKKVFIFFGLVISMINLSLQGKHSGFEKGYNEASKIFTESRFSAGTAYFFLDQQYLYIVLLSFTFLIGKLIKKEILSQVICISSLIWMIYIYWHIYLQKNIVFYREETFYDLTRDMVQFDLISFSLVLILLVFQIITAFQYYFDWKRGDVNVTRTA